MKKADRFNEGKRKWDLVDFESIKESLRLVELSNDKHAGSKDIYEKQLLLAAMDFMDGKEKHTGDNGIWEMTSLIMALCLMIEDYNNDDDVSMTNLKSLEVMVQVLEYGAGKYSPDNWKAGFKDRECEESMFRHIISYLSGEDLDAESGLSHLGHIMCNCMMLNYHRRKEAVKESERQDILKATEANSDFINSFCGDGFSNHIIDAIKYSHHIYGNGFDIPVYDDAEKSYSEWMEFLKHRDSNFGIEPVDESLNKAINDINLKLESPDVSDIKKEELRKILSAWLD